MVLIIVALIAAAQAIVLAYLAKTSKNVNQINTAVNHADHGMPTLVQRIVDQDARSIVLAADLSRTDVWRNEAIQRLADELSVRLKPQPTRVLPIDTLVEKSAETLSAKAEVERAE